MATKSSSYDSWAWPASGMAAQSLDIQLGGANDRVSLGSDNGLMCVAPLLCKPVAPASFLASSATSGTVADTTRQDEGPTATGQGSEGDISGIPSLDEGATSTTSLEVVAAFLTGYDVAGGALECRTHIIKVVECESQWRVDAVSDAGHLGLAQFAPSTWTSYAHPGTDWRDPWEQGWAAANLIGDLLDRGISPGTSAGWSWCWWQ